MPMVLFIFCMVQLPVDRTIKWVNDTIESWENKAARERRCVLVLQKDYSKKNAAFHWQPIGQGTTLFFLNCCLVADVCWVSVTEISHSSTFILSSSFFRYHWRWMEFLQRHMNLLMHQLLNIWSRHIPLQMDNLDTQDKICPLVTVYSVWKILLTHAVEIRAMMPTLVS